MTPHPLIVAALVAAVALQRLLELWLAARLLRLSAAETGARPQREAGYPLMVLLHAGWLAGCLGEPLLVARAVPLAVLAPAALVWLAALGLRGWTLRTLGRCWHVRVIERARQPIVTGGPYRYIRHPNYLAVILEIACVPLLLGAYGTALLASVANAAVLAGRIRREEAYLFAQPAYRAHFARRARLVPGVF